MPVVEDEYALPNTDSAWDPEPFSSGAEAPRSLKQILRDANIPLGGAIRAKMSKGLDDVLFVAWLSALAELDSPEDAAIFLFRLCALDPSFKPPHWAVLCFKRHRAAIFDYVN